MVVNSELQHHLNVEIAVRRKKMELLEQEIEALTNALKIVVGVEPELQTLLEEETRIEASAKMHHSAMDPTLRH